VIVLGIILLIIGFIAKVTIVWTVGVIVLIIGAVLAIAERAGHAVGRPQTLALIRQDNRYVRPG
jgi:disulfide bond formation protein DsbB